MRFHCLFEQSGTFRDIFKSYGHESWDYDIQNEYGKTDYQIDLFKQIEIAFDKLANYGNNLEDRNIKTIFDDMTPETDFIMAFFPCTYFSGMQQLNFRLQNYGITSSINKNRTCPGNILRVLQMAKERTRFFELWIKFCLVCQEVGIRTIIENPANHPSYVELFSPFLVSYKEKNRALFGDRYIKPTLYFSINFKMEENFQMYDLEPNTSYIMGRANKPDKSKSGSKERSEITSRYADNFYKRFVQGKV